MRATIFAALTVAAFGCSIARAQQGPVPLTAYVDANGFIDDTDLRPACKYLPAGRQRAHDVV